MSPPAYVESYAWQRWGLSCQEWGCGHEARDHVWHNLVARYLDEHPLEILQLFYPGEYAWVRYYEVLDRALITYCGAPLSPSVKINELP